MIPQSLTYEMVFYYGTGEIERVPYEERWTEAGVSPAGIVFEVAAIEHTEEPVSSTYQILIDRTGIARTGAFAVRVDLVTPPPLPAYEGGSGSARASVGRAGGR